MKNPTNFDKHLSALRLLRDLTIMQESGMDVSAAVAAVEAELARLESGEV